MSINSSVASAATIVASSSEETLLLTRRGEVLVCRHVDRLALRDRDEEELAADGPRDGDDDDARRESDGFGDVPDASSSSALIAGGDAGKFHWGDCCLADSKVLCCAAGHLAEGNSSPSLEGGNDERTEAEAIITNAVEESYDKSANDVGKNQTRRARQPKTATARRPGDGDDALTRPAEDTFDERIDSKSMAAGGDYDGAENDATLRGRNGLYCNGDGSPTPLMSFDYHGYEPPTPEPPMERHRDEGSVYFPAAIDPRNGGDEAGESSRSNRRIPTSDEPLYLVDPGTDPSERYCPLPATSDPSFVLPGVPTFLHALSQIRITNLSAHPRGHHVLLISEEGLLFSYGSNRCGQLGLGRQSYKRSNTPGGGDGRPCHRVATPSIVTPLLENGGKTINCAAGMDYSLVVVKTDGARIAHRKRQHQQKSRQPTKSAHHQMYGFGNNRHNKLGLLDPSESGEARGSSSPTSLVSSVGSFPDDCSDHEDDSRDHVFLPRRVALYCSVSPPKISTISGSGTPPFGIFCVAASINHSAALVRRPNGSIELYTWGRAEEGALGLGSPAAAATTTTDVSPPPPPPSEPFPKGVDESSVASNQAVFTPTLISPVSFLPGPPPPTRNGHGAKFSPNGRNRNGGRPGGRNGPRAPSERGGGGEVGSLLRPSEYPVRVSLGPSCTHVITSEGRWLAFGASSDGLLGLGKDVRSADRPTEVRVPTPTGGNDPNVGDDTRGEGRPSNGEGRPSKGKMAAISVGDRHAVGVSSRGDVVVWGRSIHGALGRSDNGRRSVDRIVDPPETNPFFDRVGAGSPGTELDDRLARHVGSSSTPPATDDSNDGANRTGRVAHAHAGLDASVFVRESGSVLSCGRQSGRLGRGYVRMDVREPGRAFGGTELWGRDGRPRAARDGAPPS